MPAYGAYDIPAYQNPQSTSPIINVNDPAVYTPPPPVDGGTGYSGPHVVGGTVEKDVNEGGVEEELIVEQDCHTVEIQQTETENPNLEKTKTPTAPSSASSISKGKVSRFTVTTTPNVLKTEQKDCPDTSVQPPLSFFPFFGSKERTQQVKKEKFGIESLPFWLAPGQTLKREKELEEAAKNKETQESLERVEAPRPPEPPSPSKQTHPRRKSSHSFTHPPTTHPFQEPVSKQAAAVQGASATYHLPPSMHRSHPPPIQTSYWPQPSTSWGRGYVTAIGYYTPALSDELEVMPGDMLLVEKVFDDG
ncbi:hypothetical protein HDV05_007330 [Chytridiales sp. JEL 0842]|nr:hypothetical protein HDV05_007330 [Chytridiales sp. JEL 0842]